MLYNEYIALGNPDAAIKLCEDYGIPINPNDLEEVSEGLAIIVSETGEKGLKDVMDIHPDRKIILELAQKAKRHLNFIGSDDEYEGFDTARFNPRRPTSIPLNYNATGDSATTASVLQTGAIMQQSTFMLLGIAVIGGILLFKK